MSHLRFALALAAAPLIAFPATTAAQAQPAPEQTREYFLEDPVAPRFAPERADVTIVSYFDYQCGHCRRGHLALETLLADDKKVAVLYRDWPILSDMSRRAARLAVASKWQGKHDAYHDQLMRLPGVIDEAGLRAAAKRADVDWTRLEADLATHGDAIDALLARNDKQAKLLGFTGTPGYIVGDSLVPGGLDAEQFTNLLKVVRARAAEPRAD